MDSLPHSLSPTGKIYLNLDQQVNVYKFGEEIHSLYRALNNMEASVNILYSSLEEIERMKVDIKKRIEALEEAVMKITPLPHSTPTDNFK